MLTPRPRTLLLILCMIAILSGLVWLLKSGTAGTQEGELQQFPRMLYLVFGGFGGSLLIVLWNSSSLTRTWLNVVGGAYKGLGSLTVVVLAFFIWNQTVSRREKEQQESRRLQDSEGRVDDLLRRMAELKDNPGARRQRIAVTRYTLNSESLTSLALAQAVYTLAITDENDEVRSEARDVLFPGEPATDFEKAGILPRNFVSYLVSFLKKRQGLAAAIPYRNFLKTLERDSYTDTHVRNAIVEILSQAASQIAELEKVKGTTGINDGDSSMLKVRRQLTSLATGERSSLLHPSAAEIAVPSPTTAESVSPDESSVTKSEKILDESARVPTEAARPDYLDTTILKELSSVDIATYAAALGSLPKEVSELLPPHVEIFDFTAGGHPGPAALKAQSALRTKGFLAPSPESRSGKPSIPPTQIEIRYLDQGATAYAQNVKLILMELNAGVTVKLDPQPPSALDLKVYPDLTKHLEVWFPPETSPSPAPAGPATPAN